MQRTLIAVLAVLALAAGATAASADRGGGHGGEGGAERVFTLQPDPAAGNPEGIAFDKRSRSFYVGITADGTIYRGTLGSETLTPFIPGGTGKAAIGLKVRRGKLYVAGGSTGTITVYDLVTKQPVATFQTGTGGFLNDLVVTRRGDVYVTDSVRATLWHVTAEKVRSGSGTPQALNVGGDDGIRYEPNAFNVNGIVAKGSRKLIVVNSFNGKLFRIELGDDRASIDGIDEIEGATVPGGDGMLLDRGRLVVVQGAPRNQLSFLTLRRGAGEVRLESTRTSARLRGPSTVDVAKGLYLVVNADFATSRKPFTVAGFPRRSNHGHH